MVRRLADGETRARPRSASTTGTSPATSLVERDDIDLDDAILDADDDLPEVHEVLTEPVPTPTVPASCRPSLSDRAKVARVTEQTETDVVARRAIEAVVLASTEPVEARLLAQLVELPVTRVEALCDELAQRVRGVRARLRARPGRRRLPLPDPSRSRALRRALRARRPARRACRPASLETLAIVAYKQPISRGQMSAIRGVNVEATLTTLLQRGYVQEVGRDPGPGAAVLYGTTREFLERLGLPSLDAAPAAR